jgi:uncharacterized protein (DUF3084 family)
MTKTELITRIRSTKGKFFTIEFTKANGEKRVANGKNFYKRLLSGGDSTHTDSPSVPFVDRNKEEFIAATGEKVTGFRCGSVSWSK